MKGNKKEKILDYTAAVIASDVIKTAGTEILGGERSSFWMIYSNRLGKYWSTECRRVNHLQICESLQE